MIYADIKPTDAYSLCTRCHKQMDKGEIRINVSSGTYHGHTNYDRLHRRCYEALHREVMQYANKLVIESFQKGGEKNA